jgi:hypothetical protein
MYADKDQVKIKNAARFRRDYSLRLMNFGGKSLGKRPAGKARQLRACTRSAVIWKWFRADCVVTVLRVVSDVGRLH